MTTENIEALVDEGVEKQLRGMLVNTLLGKAGDISLEALAALAASDRYGASAKGISLQELFDAYVENENLVPESVGEKVESVVAAPGRKKSGKKKGKKASKKKAVEASSDDDDKKGGGGGSAAPGRGVNFRDPKEKERYSASIEEMVHQRGGEAVSSTEMVAHCGGSSNQAREILNSLVKGGKVVFTGQARATRYYWREGAADEVLKEFNERQSGLEA